MKEDPDACSQLTTLSAEAYKAAESPLELLLFMLPHILWEHIAECSERKRVSIIAKESLGASRNDKKYMTRIITADRVFAFVAVLILNLLQPFPGGIKSH